MEGERRQARTRKREWRAARREQLRAWRQRNVHALDARWYVSDEDPWPIGAWLPERPAVDVPSPFFVSAAMRRLLIKLLRLIAENPGFVVITGASGIGKSAFAAWLGRELATAGHPVVVIDCADAPLDDLIEKILQRLETEQRSVPITRAAPVVIIDSAELLAEETLVGLSPLVATEMGHGQPIRAVLIGQTRLARRLGERAAHELTPLIRLRAQLKPLTNGETRRFIRALAASDSSAAPISDEVFDAIARESQGRPAHVRFLWTRAHAVAQGEGEPALRAAHVQTAAQMLRPRYERLVTARTTLAPRGGARHRAPTAARATIVSARRRVALYAATAAAFAFLWFANSGPSPDTPWPDATPAIERTAEAPVATRLASAEAMPERSTPPTETSSQQLALAEVPATPLPAETAIAAMPETAPLREASAQVALSAPALAPSAVIEKHAAPAAKEAAKPPKTRLARLDTPPHREPPALNAVVALDHAQPTKPPVAEAVMQVAMAAPQPQCEPYVSTINYAGSSANVRGTACHDASGQWWLMNQRVE